MTHCVWGDPAPCMESTSVVLPVRASMKWIIFILNVDHPLLESLKIVRFELLIDFIGHRIGCINAVLSKPVRGPTPRDSNQASLRVQWSALGTVTLRSASFLKIKSLIFPNERHMDPFVSCVHLHGQVKNINIAMSKN